MAAAVLGAATPGLAVGQGTTSTFGVGSNGAVVCGTQSATAAASASVSCASHNSYGLGFASSSAGAVRVGTELYVSSYKGIESDLPGTLHAQASWKDELTFTQYRGISAPPAQVSFLVQYLLGTTAQSSNSDKLQLESYLGLNFSANGVSNFLDRASESTSGGLEDKQWADFYANEWMQVRSVTVPFATSFLIEMTAEAWSSADVQAAGGTLTGWTGAESTRQMSLVGFQIRDAAGNDITRDYQMSSVNGTRVRRVADMPVPSGLLLVGVGLLALVRRTPRRRTVEI